MQHFITKRGSSFYYKTRKSVLQNTAAFLLQNEPFLLQNAAGITKCAVFVTKRGRYYKMSRLLQNAAQHVCLSEIVLRVALVAIMKGRTIKFHTVCEVIIFKINRYPPSI